MADDAIRPVTNAAEPPGAEADALAHASAGGRVIRGGALRVGSYLGQLLLSLIAVPLMIRHLGAVDYGRYVTVSSIVFIITGFTEGGLTYLGVRHYVALAGAQRDRHLRNLAGMRVGLTSVGLVAGVVVTWVTGADAEVVLGTAIVGFGTLLVLVQATYSVPLQAQLRFGTLSGIDLLKQAVLTGSIVVFVATGAGLVPFFWANVTSGLAVLVVTLLLVRRQVSSMRPAFELSVWRRVAHEVLPYGIAAAVGLIYFRIGVVLMSYIATPYETGIYSTAFRIVEVASTIPWIAVATGFPILVHAAANDNARMRYALQRMFETSAIVGVAFALGIGLGAQVLVDVIAGPGFEEAVPVLRLLGVALVTSFLAATWSFALLSLLRFRHLLLANALAATVAIGATLGLEPVLGAEGAAIATVIGEAVLALGYLVALVVHDRTLLPRFAFTWKVAAAAGAGAAAALLPVGAVLQTVVGLAVYAAAVVGLRALPMELVNALLRRAP